MVVCEAHGVDTSAMNATHSSSTSLDLRSGTTTADASAEAGAVAHLAMEHLPYAVSVWRVRSAAYGEQELVYANRTADETLGFPLSHHVGRRREEVFPSSVDGTFAAATRRTAATDTSVTCEGRSLGRWYKATTRPLPNGDVMVTFEACPTGRRLAAAA